MFDYGSIMYFNANVGSVMISNKKYKLIVLRYMPKIYTSMYLEINYYSSLDWQENPDYYILYYSKCKEMNEVRKSYSFCLIIYKKHRL